MGLSSRQSPYELLVGWASNAMAFPIESPAHDRFRLPHLATIAALYVVAFGPLILVHQLFWDDWVILAQSPAGLWEMFNEMGRQIQFFLVAPYVAWGDPLAWTMTSTFLYGLVPLFVYGILRRATNWPPTDVFWAALLTALAPLNEARLVLATLPYAFSCAFFAGALWLLVHDLDRPRLARRLLVAVLLLLAFTTNSFLVLAWIAPLLVGLHVPYDAGENVKTYARRLLNAVLSRGELLLLPILYWTWKSLFIHTYGIYASYNNFKLSFVLALAYATKSYFSQIAGLHFFFPSWQSLWDATAWASLILAATILVLGKRSAAIRTHDRDLQTYGHARQSRQLGRNTVIVAILLYYSAIFPYVIVGLRPSYGDIWESRHQTALVVVAGFAAIAILREILARRWLWIGAGLLSAAYLVIDLSFTRQIVADLLEQQAIGAAIAEKGSLPSGFVLVVENDRQYRALARVFRFTN